MFPQVQIFLSQIPRDTNGSTEKYRVGFHRAVSYDDLLEAVEGGVHPALGKRGDTLCHVGKPSPNQNWPTNSKHSAQDSAGWEGLNFVHVHLTFVSNRLKLRLFDIHRMPQV